MSKQERAAKKLQERKDNQVEKSSKKRKEMEKDYIAPKKSAKQRVV